MISIEEKSIWIIFSWRKSNLECWSEKFLSRGAGRAKEEYDDALDGNKDLNKKIVKLDDFIELACRDLILSINRYCLKCKMFVGSWG